MQCVYCGREAGETKDHVPAKCLLRKPLPPDLLTVPCCGACNGGASKDEEYFRLIVIGLMCHTHEANLLFDGPLTRSMDRNSHLESLMFGSLRPIDRGVAIDVQYPRIFRVAEKIARGLEFVATGVMYPVGQQFDVVFAEVESGAGELQYAPDFTYQRSVGREKGWEFTFFDSVRFVVQPRSSGGFD